MKKLQKIVLILTGCGLILATAGCGALQSADTDRIDTDETVEAVEDTVEKSGTAKGTDTDEDTDIRKTADDTDGDTEDGAKQVSSLTQTPDTASAKTGPASDASGTADTGQKTSASGTSGTPGTNGTATVTENPSSATDSGRKDETTVTPTESTVTHIHEWAAVYKTVDHPEEGHYEQVLIGEEYTNPICEYHEVCYCGFDYTANGVTPGDCPNCSAGWHTVRVITGYETVPAIYEDRWIVDKAAWSEQVVDYYQCSECGQIK